MGTIKQGILGGFSGRVGTVIGGSWKGISYMRSMAQNVTNPRTDSQVGQRTRFSLILGFLQSMIPFIRVGFRPYAIKQTAFNAAMSYNVKNAIMGTAPNYSIDFEQVMVSRGTLVKAIGVNSTASTGKFTFTWEDNSGIGNALATDLAMPLIFNKDKGEAIYKLDGPSRSTKTYDFLTAAAWAGDMVEIYLSFVSADGTLVSDSVFVLEDGVAS